MLFAANTAYATDYSKIEVRGSVNDETSTVQDTGAITKYFASYNRQSSLVTLTASGFTNISIPTNSKAVLIDVISADGIKLKGVTGDTGISLDATCPVLLPLSTDGTTTIGIQNMEASAQTIRVMFF